MTPEQAKINGAAGGRAKRFVNRDTWSILRVWLAPDLLHALKGLKRAKGGTVAGHVRVALWQYVERELLQRGS